MANSTLAEFSEDSHQDRSLQTEGVESQLAQIILDVIYNQWQKVWKSHLNSEPNSLPYREIPNLQFILSEKKNDASPFDKFILMIRSWFTKPEQKTESNRGWRLVVKRGKDGSATIFYAGNIPDSSEFAGKPGLKILHAKPDGTLYYGYIPEIVCPSDNKQLSTIVSESRWGNERWTDILEAFDKLDQEIKDDIKQLLFQKEYSSGVIQKIHKDIDARISSGFGEDYPFDKP